MLLHMMNIFILLCVCVCLCLFVCVYVECEAVNVCFYLVYTLLLPHRFVISGRVTTRVGFSFWNGWLLLRIPSNT